VLFGFLTALPARAQSPVFGGIGASFDHTPAMVTFAGNTATLASSTDKFGGFTVQDSGPLFPGIGGRMLEDSGGNGGDTLTVHFAKPVDGMRFRFGLLDIGSKSQGKADTLAVSVNDGPPKSYPGHYERDSLFQVGDVQIAGPVRSMTITSQYAFVIGL